MSGPPSYRSLLCLLQHRAPPASCRARSKLRQASRAATCASASASQVSKCTRQGGLRLRVRAGVLTRGKLLRPLPSWYPLPCVLSPSYGHPATRPVPCSSAQSQQNTPPVPPPLCYPATLLAPVAAVRELRPEPPLPSGRYSGAALGAVARVVRLCPPGGFQRAVQSLPRQAPARRPRGARHELAIRGPGGRGEGGWVGYLRARVAVFPACGLGPDKAPMGSQRQSRA